MAEHKRARRTSVRHVAGLNDLVTVVGLRRPVTGPAGEPST